MVASSRSMIAEVPPSAASITVRIADNNAASDAEVRAAAGGGQGLDGQIGVVALSLNRRRFG